MTRLLADSKAFHLIIELDISSRNWAGSEAQWREDLSQGRKWSCFVGWAPREDERSGWGWGWRVRVKQNFSDTYRRSQRWNLPSVVMVQS